MHTGSKQRRFVGPVLLALALVAAACTSNDDDPEPDAAEPTVTEPETTEPETTETTEIPDAVETRHQDVWLLEGVATVGPDGEQIDLAEDLLAAAAAADLGEPVSLAESTEFQEWPDLNARLVDADGSIRDDVPAVGGIITVDRATGIMIVATPDSDDTPPIDDDDEVRFDLPAVGHLVEAGDPLVFDYGFGHTFGPDEEDAPDAGVDLLVQRTEHERVRYLAVDDGAQLITDLGQVYDSTGDVDFAVAQDDKKSGGMPAKSKPMMDGFKDGLEGCKGDLGCVRKYWDKFGEGAASSWKKIEDQLCAGPTAYCIPPCEEGDDDCQPTCQEYRNCGGGGGDPHIRTFDNRRYDLQSVGEFVLARSDDWVTHLRLVAPDPDGSYSLTDVVATRMGDVTIILDPGGDDRAPSVMVNGESVDVPNNAAPVEVEDLVITHVKGYLSVEHPQYGLVTVRTDGSRMVEVVSFDDEATFEGILGNGDDDRDNDFRLGPGGGVVPPDGADHDFIHGPFADAWRVTDETSLLPYGPGETTADYTDPSFPRQPIADVVADSPRRARAEALCRIMSVEDGAALDNCIADYVLTGDVSWVTAALREHLRSETQAGRLPDPASADVDVSGEYETTYGPMVLTVDGVEVTGVYDAEGGKVAGELDGAVLTGIWFGEPSAVQECDEERVGSRYWGVIEFTFTDGGDHFDGLWGYCDEPAERNWTGDRE